LADDVPPHRVQVAVCALERARRVQRVDAAGGIRRVDGGFGRGSGVQRRAPHGGDLV
jgi:hypothetical protein